MKTPVLWRYTLWLPCLLPGGGSPLQGLAPPSSSTAPRLVCMLSVLLQFLDPRCSKTFSPKVGLFLF